MPYCVNCGRKAEDNAYCPACGTPIASAPGGSPTGGPTIYFQPLRDPADIARERDRKLKATALMLAIVTIGSFTLRQFGASNFWTLSGGIVAFSSWWLWRFRLVDEFSDAVVVSFACVLPVIWLVLPAASKIYSWASPR